MKSGLLIACIALLGLGASAHADYTMPTQAQMMSGFEGLVSDSRTSPARVFSEFQAFAGDFASWNTRMNNQPMMELQWASANGQTNNVALWLWLEWLLSRGDGSVAGNPESGNGATGGVHVAGSPVGVGNTESPLGNPGQGSPPPGGSGIEVGPPTSGIGTQVDANPEPSSLTLLGTGFLGFLGYGYTRRRRARAKA